MYPDPSYGQHFYHPGYGVLYEIVKHLGYGALHTFVIERVIYFSCHYKFGELGGVGNLNTYFLFAGTVYYIY